MNSLLTDALTYHGRGWSIIPVHGKSAAVKWKDYQNRRPTSEEVQGWFSGQEHSGLAVIFGPVSGRLACRDFDREGSYEQWAEQFRELAQSLPTAKTPRGYHVYFTADVPKTLKFRDGELRVAGSYCCLPPSTHPDGGVYRWLIPPGEEIPEVDPHESGFIPSEDTETEADRSKQSKQKIQSKQSRQSKPIAIALCVQERVTQAISATLPTGPGQRNRCVFDYARRLRGITGLSDAGPASLKPLVRQWHGAALPVVRTKAFEETWADFVIAWDRITTAHDPDLLHNALAEAKKDPVPDVDYECPEARDLVGLCRQLQRRQGDGPFFLSSRKAGEVLGIDFRTANRWLIMLAADGWIELVVRGGGASNARKANRYRYLGATRREERENGNVAD